MNTGMIPARYATALLSFAAESKQEDVIYEKAKLIVRNFSEQPKLRTALDNPVLGSGKKKEIILAASGNVANTVFDKFIDLVVSKKRENFLQTIMLKFIDLYRLKNNIYSGKLISAGIIDEPTEKKLISVIEGRKNGKLEIEKSVDADLIGGFILEVENTRWDASIKRQLQTIKNELSL